MAQDPDKRLEEIFHAAVGLPAAQRAAYLARECGDDAGLRAEVESLIRHHEEAGTAFLRPVDWRGDPNAAQPASPAGVPSPGAAENPPAETQAAADSPGGDPNPPGGPNPPIAPSPRVGPSPAGAEGQPPGGDAPAETVAAPKSSPRGHGPSIEGYEIIKELHRGGQGIVYQAIQKSTKRKVAIKILLEGPYASKAARRRFEREIELVARLRHPNIVEVFHSGETADGRQYAVMDYVRGKPLDLYVKEKKPTLEEALALFTTICEAVNYAHQRGVIHRDLKPSNILVDHEGHPKVLDFGLAKQMAGPEASLVSMTGQVVGTLPYMSPEQARGNPDEIDIRTDVYALGVILYEMLTGAYPYPVVGQMAEVLKHIAETPPTPPSRTWKSGSGVTQRTHKRLRLGACPIDDEVQTIVLRSLTKEQDRRYQSAGELARDVEHYLKDEPIEAKKDSRLYLLKTAIKRNKVPFGIAAAFMIVLAAAAIGMAVLWRESQRQTAIAQGERDRAEEAVEKEKSARQEADVATVRERQARADAEEQRNAAELDSYIANISAASNALAHNEFEAVHARLAACPEQLRRWEWGYLNASSSHESLVSLETEYPGGGCCVRGASFVNNSATIILKWLKTIRTYDVKTGRELARVDLNPAFEERALDYSRPPRPSRFAFNPDQSLVVHGEGSNVCIWDSRSGKRVLRIETHNGEVSSAEFSADGKRIVTGHQDGTAIIWDATTGDQLAILRNEEALEKNKEGFELEPEERFELMYNSGSRLAQASISPRGNQVVTVSWVGIANIFDANSGRFVRKLNKPGEKVNSATYSPDSMRIVLTMGNHSARTVFGEPPIPSRSFQPVNISPFDPKGMIGKPVGNTIRDCPGDPVCSAFSPDGSVVAIGSREGQVSLWRASYGIEQKIAEMRIAGQAQGPIASICFSADGTRLLTAGLNGNVHVWDARVYPTPVVSSTGDAATFSPDGRLLLVSDFSDLKVYEILTGAMWSHMRLTESTRSLAPRVSFSPDGNQIIGARLGGVPFTFDAITGICRDRPPKADAPGFTFGAVNLYGDAQVTPDGRRIVTTDWRAARARIWSSEPKQELAVVGCDMPPSERPDKIEGKFVCVAYSPDGTRIATGGTGPCVQVQDSFAHDKVLRLHGHSDTVRFVQFSSDGQRLVTASDDTTAIIWDATTGTKLFILKGHSGGALAAAFNPAGDRVVTTARGDANVRIWDARCGKEVLTLRFFDDSQSAYYSSNGRSVCFSPDGTQLVVTGNGRVRVLNSIPFRERWAEINAIVSARDEAEQIINERLQNQPDITEVLRGIREDRSLREPLRLASISILASRAGGVFRIFQDLAALCPVKVELLNAIAGQSDFPSLRGLYSRTYYPQLGSELPNGWPRPTWELNLLKKLIESWSASGEELNEYAWEFVVRFREKKSRMEHLRWQVPSMRPEDFELKLTDWALAAAQEAVRLRPDDGGAVNTLGAVQFRAGQYVQALATLTRAVELNRIKRIVNTGPPSTPDAARETPDAGSPYDAVFLAMTLKKLGRPHEAVEQLRRAESLAKLVDPWTTGPDLSTLLAEAREVVLGAASSQPTSQPASQPTTQPSAAP